MQLVVTLLLAALVSLSASGMAAFYHLPTYIILAPVVASIGVWLIGGRYALGVFWRVVLPIVLGVVMVEAYRWSHTVPWLKANIWTIPVNGNTAEQFFAVMATLYAVTTALVLVKAIESFDHLFKAITTETDKIRAISDFLIYMQGTPQNVDTIGKLRQLFRDYLGATFRDPRKTVDDSARRLSMSVKLIARLECEDENDRIALGEVMKSMNELSAIRAERIALTNYRVPGYLVVMLAVMSLSMIMTFFVDPAEKISHNYTIIFLLTVFSSFIILLLLDIADPFDGFWEVDISPYDTTRRYLDEQLAEQAGAPNGPPLNLPLSGARMRAPL